MAYHSLKKTLSARLADIRAAGLYKSERQILGPQGAEIRVAQGEVLNLCANNYLGLANHPDIRQAAASGLQEHGYGPLQFLLRRQRRAL
jgi:glycine C-acetyltransferase